MQFSGFGALPSMSKFSSSPAMIPGRVNPDWASKGVPSYVSRPARSRAALPPAASLRPAAVPQEGRTDANSEAARGLKEGIASFYDESSGLWEEMWGEHMHHGYYAPGAAGAPERGDEGGMARHQRAQVEMIEQALQFAGVPDPRDPASEGQPRSILDVGCGIGGSARYLARKYQGAQVKGVTLSPRQAQRGNDICRQQGLQNQVALEVADAMATPFADGSFDLLWSMESGEHMPDKRQFVGELARLAAPGGRVIIVTWCHRDLDEARGETSLQPWEQELLQRVCDAYYLPAWCSARDYARIAEGLGLRNVRLADWSEFVTPFWPAVIASALSLKGFLGLLRTGWTTMRGALAMLYMVQGYSKGVIKFAIITAEK